MANGRNARRHQDTIVYALDVGMFQDGNGDGIGDFVGLARRLDVVDLGVTCLWLLSFHPTPNRVNGYDVVDYDRIDPRFGTLDDFARFRRAAADRGLRLILDLVVHHTSDQHPWFRAARLDRCSPFRNYYVWTGEDLSPQRSSVRTVMQWSAAPNGGFSTAAPESLVTPAIRDGAFG